MAILNTVVLGKICLHSIVSLLFPNNDWPGQEQSAQVWYKVTTTRSIFKARSGTILYNKRYKGTLRILTDCLTK